VQDESTVTLAQEIKRLAAKYGPERFTETSLGFKLAFVSAEGTTKAQFCFKSCLPAPVAVADVCGNGDPRWQSMWWWRWSWTL
jgi:hypothetical protein